MEDQKTANTSTMSNGRTSEEKPKGKRGSVLALITRAVENKLTTVKAGLVVKPEDGSRALKYTLTLSTPMFKRLQHELVDVTGPIVMEDIWNMTLNVNEWASVTVRKNADLSFSTESLNTLLDVELTEVLVNTDEMLYLLRDQLNKSTEQAWVNNRWYLDELKKEKNVSIKLMEEIAALKRELRSKKKSSKK